VDNGGVSAQTQQPRRKPFAEQSVGDLLRSIVLLLLAMGVIFGIGSLITEEEETPVRTVGYAGRLSAARDLADYSVLAPRGLDATWVPTSVDLQSSGGTVRWHLGFLTPGDEYVGLEQGDYEAQDLVRRYVGGLQPSGKVSVGGESWELYRGDTDNALLRRDGDVVTIVVGTAPTDQLTLFARSLL
jgi:Protein of unknown function (DUF4245)